MGFRVGALKTVKTILDREAIKERLRHRGIPEELLTHIQHMVLFRPSDRKALKQIAQWKLDKVKESLFRQKGKMLDIDAKLVESQLAKERTLPSPTELKLLGVKGMWQLHHNMVFQKI